MNLAYERYPEIWKRSKGVVFLGTPHRGSATAAPAKVFGDIFNVVWHASGGGLFRRGIKTDLLRALGQNSSELMGIAEDFRLRANSLSITTFYEQFVTEPLGSVVCETCPIAFLVLRLLITNVSPITILTNLFPSGG